MNIKYNEFQIPGPYLIAKNTKKVFCLFSGQSVDIESRLCNTNPCTHVSFSTRTISKVVVCNPITLQKCTV